MKVRKKWAAALGAIVLGVALTGIMPLAASADVVHGSDESCTPKPAVEAVVGVDGYWKEFSPNQEQGPFEGPPTYPTDERGTWSDPTTEGGPQQGTSGVFQNGEGNGSWFYRVVDVDAVAGEPAILCEWYTWDTNKWSPTATDANSVHFDQTLVGPGKIAPTKCETTYQQDLYQGTRAEIDAILDENTLNYGEDFGFAKAWVILSTEECDDITAKVCESATVLPTSTNLATQGWALTNGEYVEGGVKFTSSNWAGAYAYKATSFPLSEAANLDFSTTGGDIWAIILETAGGNIHYEPAPYTDPLWTNAAGILPANGGGQGGPYSGDLDDLLSDPTVTGVYLYYTSGSETPASGVLHSGSFNCYEQPFDHQDRLVPAVFDVSPGLPTCTAAGTFDTSVFPIVREGYTLTVDRAYNGPGVYTITATAHDGFTFEGEGDPTVRTADVTVDAMLYGPEACPQDIPDPLTGEDVTQVSKCVEPANGTAEVTTTTTAWTQAYVWDEEAREYVLGEKVFAKPVVTTSVVAAGSCAPGLADTGFNGVGGLYGSLALLLAGVTLLAGRRLVRR